jgi:DNA-binding NtrC family response regulator
VPRTDFDSPDRMPSPTSSPPDQIVAAIFNTSPDLVDLVRRTFEPAGIVTVSLLTREIREGGVDLEAFIRQHDPHVIVYDIAPPYDANWALFQHICRMDVMRGRQYVVTSVNAKQVDLLSAGQPVYEIVGKPYDLDRLVHAVKEASRARPTR